MAAAVAVVAVALYNGERAALELFLAAVLPEADEVVLVESMRTFSGRPKAAPFAAADVPASPKITVLLLEGEAGAGGAWDAERRQRDSAAPYVLRRYGRCVVVACDIDEVPRPGVLRALRACHAELDAPVHLEMDMYYYNFLWRKPAPWSKAFAVNERGLAARGMDAARTDARRVVPRAGWHCSYFSGPAEIARKLRSFSHVEFDDPRFTDVALVRERVWRGLDFALRPGEDLFGGVHHDLPPGAAGVQSRLVAATRGAGLRVGFLSNQLSLRGTEVAMLDYAVANETVLGNQSVVLAFADAVRDAEPAFRAAGVPIVFLRAASEIDDAVERLGLDALYVIKGGWPDDRATSRCRCCVHVVFDPRHPHGDAVAAVVSPSLNARFGTRLPVVPHVVRDPPPDGPDLRAELGIPAGARVFGRHGGADTFDIDFARRAVVDAAAADGRTFFVFMNTERFGPPMPNVVFLPGTCDRGAKAAFVRTCDAMLHARRDGETFGLACAEFARAGRPVLTWAGSGDRAHIDALGAAAVLYHGYDDLVAALARTDLRPGPPRGYEGLGEAAVMRAFRDVFLDGL